MLLNVVLLNIIYFSSAWTRVCNRPTRPWPHHFLRNKEKGKKRKKERVSKQKLLRGCHEVQNVTFLVILERLEFKIFLLG